MLQDHFSRVGEGLFADPRQEYDRRFATDLNERILLELANLPGDSLCAGPDIVITNEAGVTITVKVLYAQGEYNEDEDILDNELGSRHYYLVAFAGEHPPEAAPPAEALVGFKASHLFTQDNRGTVHGYLAIRNAGKGYMSLLESANEIYKGMLAHDEALQLTSEVSNDNMVSLEQYQKSIQPIEATFRDLEAELEQLQQRVLSLPKGSMSWRSTHERIQYINELLDLREDAHNFIRQALQDRVAEQQRWNNAYASLGYTRQSEYGWTKPVSETEFDGGETLSNHRQQISRIRARKSRNARGAIIHSITDYETLPDSSSKQRHWSEQRELWQNALLTSLREIANQ